ncbi:MAG: histidine phosphatase family protein [Candidatus Yanofskybacteria bacterium]|nr:histidine phosphatase family protein [Candidatus Yanofskybacteria bacterium]
MKFILTLHGTTEWDSAGRLKGQMDIPLNSRGREEAGQFGNSFLNLGITMIVSSDLKRTKETAEILILF